MTIPSAVQYPTVLKDREAILTWELLFMNERGPPAIDGTSQIRNLIGGSLWSCSLEGVALRTRLHILAWQEFSTLLEGGKEAVDVPVFMCGLTPKAASGDIEVRNDGDWRFAF